MRVAAEPPASPASPASPATPDASAEPSFAEKPSVATRRIRALRGPKPYVDPWKAHGAIVEDERRPDGTLERSLTIFLAGSECPFTCSFCDLWRFTTDAPTPIGALPHQIEQALRSQGWTRSDEGDREDEDVNSVARLKLYNASNFFDRRAVPIADVPRIAELASAFAGVTVESHATMIGPQTLEFARLLRGRLEVAVGLETVHPTGIAHLNKRMDLARFDRAAAFLADNGIDLRVFVLLGTPYVPKEEQVEWSVRSAEYAARRGASVVSVIPVRGGNGELERLGALGHFVLPTLAELQKTLEACLGLDAGSTVFAADLWDVERLPGCVQCRAQRIERIRRMNLTGRVEPAISCGECS